MTTDKQIVCSCEEGSVTEEDAELGVSPSIFKIYSDGEVECVECGSTYKWNGKDWNVGVNDEVKEAIDDNLAEIEAKIIEYIAENMRGGIRVTNIESMFQAIEVYWNNPLYKDKEKIVADLIRQGELLTFTETWRDYCWLIPKDIDHITMYPKTSATVRCEPFGYGMDGPWEKPVCEVCRTNRIQDWDDPECSYCTEAREEGRPTPGSTGP